MTLRSHLNNLILLSFLSFILSCKSNEEQRHENLKIKDVSMTVDLGESAAAYALVENPFQQEIELSNITTSCSCLELPTQSIIVPAKGTANIPLRGKGLYETHVQYVVAAQTSHSQHPVITFKVEFKCEDPIDIQTTVEEINFDQGDDSKKIVFEVKIDHVSKKENPELVLITNKEKRNITKRHSVERYSLSYQEAVEGYSTFPISIYSKELNKVVKSRRIPVYKAGAFETRRPFTVLQFSKSSSKPHANQVNITGGDLTKYEANFSGNLKSKLVSVRNISKESLTLDVDLEKLHVGEKIVGKIDLMTPLSKKAYTHPVWIYINN